MDCSVSPPPMTVLPDSRTEKLSVTRIADEPREMGVGEAEGATRPKALLLPLLPCGSGSGISLAPGPPLFSTKSSPSPRGLLAWRRLAAAQLVMGGKFPGEPSVRGVVEPEAKS